MAEGRAKPSQSNRKENQKKKCVHVFVCFSQLRQFIHWRVKFEVWREEVSGSWVDEAVRLADGDVSYSGDISDFCTEYKKNQSYST